MRESLKMPTIACPQQGTTETILTSEMTIWKLSDLVFCFIVLATLFGLTTKRIGHEHPRVGGGGGGTWVKFCRVCVAGLSEPLPHYSLFCGQL